MRDIHSVVRFTPLSREYGLRNEIREFRYRRIAYASENEFSRREENDMTCTFVQSESRWQNKEEEEKRRRRRRRRRKELERMEYTTFTATFSDAEQVRNHLNEIACLGTESQLN